MQEISIQFWVYTELKKVRFCGRKKKDLWGHKHDGNFGNIEENVTRK